MTAAPQRLHPQGVSIDHDDIRWRVSNTWQKGDTKMGMLVGYIDARTCMEALDTLDPNWSAVHGDPIIIGNDLVGVPCALTVNGVTRSDVGMPSSQDPIKGAYSDALKRAAVHFDIGRELYELPKIAVECNVDERTGKAKSPKATPVYRNGRWEIDRKYGWVRYDREPDEQPERRGPAVKAASTPSGAPVPRTPEEDALVAELFALPGMSTARASLLADAVGVEKGTRANAEQLRAMLARATQPGESAPSPVDPPEAGTLGPASGSTPLPEGSTAAATPAASAPLRAEPSAAPSLDDVLTVSGGEEIDGSNITVMMAPPPKPGTAEYRALPNGTERANAKAYWDQRKDDAPAQESLAAALGGPDNG